MTATSAKFITPRDRLVYEITKEATTMALDDLSYVLNQITLIKAMRMAAELDANRMVYDPETDPHGA